MIVIQKGNARMVNENLIFQKLRFCKKSDFLF